MFLPQNIQFLLNLENILAGKLILEQALPAFATAWLRHCSSGQPKNLGVVLNLTFLLLILLFSTPGRFGNVIVVNSM